MTWTIEFDKKAVKELRKLDKSAQKRIISFLEERVSKQANPRTLGSQLKGGLNHLWRYRVGTYRLLCQIEDGKLTVLVIHVGHRKDIYQQPASWSYATVKRSCEMEKLE